MGRKAMTVQGASGRVIRVTVGVKAKERILDPIGFLTKSSTGLTKDEQAAFADWKAKVQSGEIEINYP
jgi:hypothetical protein